jgi:hypothetical protein
MFRHIRGINGARVAEAVSGGWRGARVGTRVKQAVMLLGASSFMAAGGAGVAASAAHANLVGGCVGPFWGYLQQDLCVQGEMGGKNYSNHTQWVGNVAANSPTGFNTLKEVWGDGFFSSGWGVNRSWWIGRWVRSGTYICAAANDFEPGDSREVACIAIRV